MRGVVFTGNRTLEVTSFDDPEPGPGQAVIRMKASGMCGSDLHFYRAENPLDFLVQQGLITLGAGGMDASSRIIAGHEPCGVIEAVGPGVDPARFRPGDRVIVFHYEGCGTCDHCRTGWTQMCEEGTRPHGAVKHGGHADYMLVPASTLVKLPEQMSFVAGAAVACGTGTAYGAILRLNLSARDTLAVFGLGPVGLSAVQLAAAMGVEVIGVDIDPGRVAAAKAFGAAHAINGKTHDPVEEIHRLTRGKGASCAMDCAGGNVAKQQAVRATATWGRIALVAVGGNLDVVGWNDMIARQRTVVGSWTFSITGMKECAWFIADHGVEVDKVFSDRWTLDQAAQAYTSFDKQAGGKGVFVFD
ncbi:zinc-dependent alcohol dehydrogenase family protein [Antarctobacter sp.]|uniref:zinc-dependent alcohol dehydrogenase family protein n=1 Tax=Antarctobacter sp. TaxID=1872577 RepID=UPI003A906A39